VKDYLNSYQPASWDETIYDSRSSGATPQPATDTTAPSTASGPGCRPHYVHSKP
jgi:hypothetical protein